MLGKGLGMRLMMNTGILYTCSAHIHKTRVGMKRNENIYECSSLCWVGRSPKRFLSVTLCFENLSSGEKRATGIEQWDVNGIVHTAVLLPAGSHIICITHLGVLNL